MSNDKHWGGMQVDLDVDGTQVAGLPRFQQAVFQGRRLRQFAIGLGALAAAGLVAGVFCRAVCAAVALARVAGQSERRFAGAGRRFAIGLVGDAMARAGDESRSCRSPLLTKSLPRWAGTNGCWIGLSQRWLRMLVQIGAPTLWLGGWALLALLSIEQVWNLALAASRTGIVGQCRCGAVVVAGLRFAGAGASTGAGKRRAMARSSAVGAADSGGDHRPGAERFVPVVRQRNLGMAGASGGTDWLAARVGRRRAAVARRAVVVQSAAANNSNLPCWREASSPTCCAGRRNPCWRCSTNCTTASASTCGRSGPSLTCVGHFCRCWPWCRSSVGH